MAELRIGRVLLHSDNGGLPFGAYSNRGFNWPLRGAKGTLWEGGVRVPAFVWSSKFLKKPRVSDQLMHISDWLPTLYSARKMVNPMVSIFSSHECRLELAM
ncbi:hypothetical protein HPB47_020197 [Ixodes persulcatus]|uniref:Uncharacterized protein n=1 Tax=Ixodes persulcatus TaxID=34615 RepID=A0AC60QJL3_IXOPE|nr:hypothetical protein HPB47_020197 [Ixodes persulcatus]